MTIKEKEEITYNSRRAATHAKYLFDSGKISKKDFDKLSLYIRYIGTDYTFEKEVKNYYDNMLRFKKQLLSLYKKMIEISDGSEFKACEFNQKDNLLNEVIEFFKYMNCYSLYKTLKDNKMICFQTRSKNDNYCYKMDELSYIMLYKKNPGYFMGIAFAHEMGHAVHHNVLKGMKQYYPTPIEEIISICFERIFYNFLLENNIIDSTDFEKITKDSFHTYYSYIKYVETMIENLSNPKYSVYLSGDNVAVVDDANKKQINYSLYDNNYAFANIASAKLFMQYLNDDRYFIKHLPNIINDIGQMPMKELITQYGDISSYKGYLRNIKILGKK